MAPRHKGFEDVPPCRHVAWLATLALVGGVALLVAGATGMVQGGSGLARRAGVSPLLIGLTVVSLGTTAPELLVSTNAAWQGRPGVAAGTATGSVLINLLLVLGIAALAAPLVVRRASIRRDLPILAAAAAIAWLLCRDGLLSRADGLILAALVVPFLVHIYREERKGWIAPAEAPKGVEGRPVWMQVTAMLLGLVALAGGGRLAIAGAEAIIEQAAIPGRIVGSLLLAVGTSLPELATALIAVRHRRADIAVGNVIGANVLNLLLVLGTAATVRPLDVVADTWRVDLPAIFVAVALVAVLAASESRLRRSEGAIMVAAYLAYAVFLVAPAL